MECNDSRCPVHGSISTRGAQMEGRVVSSKAKKTVIVEIDYTRYIYKYERYLRKRSRIPAHNPDCMAAKEGDTVQIAETRRLSKTKSFVVSKVNR
ncbi:MAG: 30S ribosomal protein S17 [Candidatus Marsarchaeota archaeon]|jgi:small subunit ribosomal protein S17|nr:30S ribosomal protein S17 [Candidatus Marsarchaeota archaeon]